MSFLTNSISVITDSNRGYHSFPETVYNVGQYKIYEIPTQTHLVQVSLENLDKFFIVFVNATSKLLQLVNSKVDTFGDISRKRITGFQQGLKVTVSANMPTFKVTM